MRSITNTLMARLRPLAQIDPRWRLAAALIAVAAVCTVFMTISLVVAIRLLPQVIYLDWSRSLFLWDPMPRIPKVVLLLLYAISLGLGMFMIAMLVRIFNASESGAACTIARVKGLCATLLQSRIRTAAAIVVLGCLPLAWALFVTPFRVPNEFLALQTQTKSTDGKLRSSLAYLAERQLEGLEIPVPGQSSHQPFKLALAGTAASAEARGLVYQFPELYWFDESTGMLEIHRIGDLDQYKTLLQIADPRVLADLQRRFRDEMGDALALATRQYTTEEKDFLLLNRPELERSLVLGRFFYHHNFIFSAAVAMAQDPQVEHGSQYGKGLTQGFAAVLAAVPEALRFNAYLLLLYASYPLYLLLVVAVGRGCGLTPWQLCFVAAATVASFLLSSIETVRLGVGLAPWRHVFDVVVLYALWHYVRRSSAVNWAVLGAIVFASIFWSREMGLFIGLSAIGALLAIAIQQRQLRKLFPVACLAIVVVMGWLVSDPHAQALTWAVLLGANTPNIPWGFVTATSMLVCGLLAAWLWLSLRLNGDRQALGRWGVAGATLFYTAASCIYLMYYPRPHHLAPIIPAMALGVTSGWILFAQSKPQGTTMSHMRLVASSATAVLLLGVCILAVLRVIEIVDENRIFATHTMHHWDFPAARLVSTGDPALVKQSVDMIRARNPQAVVDILSPWETLLLPLSGKGKNGPFVLSFDSLLTENEVNLLADHLVKHGNEQLFVDSRIIAGQYDLPLLEGAYLQNLVMASVLRMRAHAILREVFTRIQGCYRLEEEGPLISTYLRVSKDCRS